MNRKKLKEKMMEVYAEYCEKKQILETSFVAEKAATHMEAHPLVGYTSKKRDKMTVYCHLCHETNVVHPSYGYVSCPNKNCRAHGMSYEVLLLGKSYIFKDTFTIIHEVDTEKDYMVGVLVEVCHEHEKTYPEDTEDKQEFLKRPMCSTVQIYAVFSVSGKEGFLVYKDGDIQRKNGRNFKYVQNALICSNVLDYRKKEAVEYLKGNPGTSYKIIENDFEILHAIIHSEPQKSNKKRVSATGLSELRIRDEEMDCLEPLLLFEKSESGNCTIGGAWCTCGHTFDLQIPYSEGARDILCPFCGREININSSKKTSDEPTKGIFIDLDTLCNDIVIRVALLKRNLFRGKNGELRHSTECEETDRFFFGAKGTRRQKRNKENEWGLITSKKHMWEIIRDTYFWDSIDMHVFTKCNDFQRILEKSYFANKGVLEAYGFADNPACKPICNYEDYRTGTKRFYSQYFIAISEYPFIEQIYKAGLVRMVKDAIDADDTKERMTLATSSYGLYKQFVDKEAGDAKSIIRVDRPVLKMAVKGQLSLYEANCLQKIYRADNRIDLETFGRLKEYHVPTLIQIKTNFGIGLMEQVKYFDECWNEQRIPSSQAVQIWVDYLNAAKALKYRLKEKYVRFPDSLKREHDKATYAYTLLQQVQTKEKFTKKIKKDKKYIYEDQKYMIILPEAGEDIIEEGNALHHCVGTYVDSVAQDRTSIFFLREREEPDKPFFTIEVKNGELRQAKGFGNMLPSLELQKFLKKWAKEKDILYTGNL